MRKYIRSVVRSRRPSKGASAVEYGLLVAAIAAVIMIVLFALGNVLEGGFQKTCDTIKSGVGPAQTCPH